MKKKKKQCNIIVGNLVQLVESYVILPLYSHGAVLKEATLCRGIVGAIEKGEVAMVISVEICERTNMNHDSFRVKEALIVTSSNGGALGWVHDADTCLRKVIRK